MARHPQLGKKTINGNTYYYTQAGGSPVYFGNVEDTPLSEAKDAFARHLVSLGEEVKDRKRGTLTAGELMDLFLEWFKDQSEANYKNRVTHLSSFGRFCPRGGKVHLRDLPAHRITDK